MDKHIKPVLYNKFYISTVFTNLKLQHTFFSFILFIIIHVNTCYMAVTLKDTEHSNILNSTGSQR